MAAKTKGSEKVRYVVVSARAPGTNWARWMAGDLVRKERMTDGTSVVTLRNARQADYFGRATAGELGLAAHGPRGDSRIGAPVPGEVEIAAVNLCAEASEIAAKAWRDAPIWSPE